MELIQDWLSILIVLAIMVLSTRLFMNIAERIGRLLGLGDLVIGICRKISKAVKAK